MWLIWILLAALSTQGSVPTQDRRLEPIPEPFVRELHTVFLPLLEAKYPEIESADDLRPIYGYASPHRRSYNVPYYNWRAIVADCDNPSFWPMVRGQAIEPDMLRACDNGLRRLLLYNEPELDHFSATPREAVRFVRDWTEKWSGPVACCGNFYTASGGRDGLVWFKTFVAEYVVRYDELPPIDAIHIHVYAWLSADVERLREWREIAELYDWRVIISEAGIFTSQTYAPEEVASHMPEFLLILEDVFTYRLLALIWFSDYLQPWVLGDGTAWHHFNLTNVDGAITDVGKVWEAHIGRSIEGDLQK